MTTSEIAAFIVRLERDPARSRALDHGYDLFRAAVEDGLVGDGEIDLFAERLGEAVDEDELIGYRAEHGGVTLGPGKWTNHHLQSRFRYYSTLDGQQAAQLHEQRGQGTPETLSSSAEPPWAATAGLVEYVFDLPPAEQLAPLVFSPEEERVLRQYLVHAERIRDSTVLNTPSIGYRVEFTQSEAAIETNWPASDALAGLATLFRHLYAPDERASFQAAMKVIQTRLRDAGLKDSSDELQTVACYGRAARQLRLHWLRQLAFDKGVAQGRIQSILGGPGMVPEKSPEQVLGMFFYGEHIHWGKRAEEVDSLAEDPFHDAALRLAFLSAVISLSIIYFAFAKLVERVIDQDESAAA